MNADEKLMAAAGAAVMVEEMSKVDWKRLICVALPIYNMVAPMFGGPILPIPAFCSTPANPPA